MSVTQRKVLVVGTGSIGLRHARLCMERGDLIVECCDSREAGLEEAKRTLGDVRCWNSLDEALTAKPDIVIVATPHDHHEPVAVAAMKAGAHVLCEKPMSHSAEAAAHMLRVQRETGRTLRIGYNMHFHPAIRRLKQLIDDGVLGTPALARYVVGSYFTLECSRSRHQRDLFGAIIMDYAHGLDLMLWLLKRTPAGVYARGIQAGNVELTSNPNVLSSIFDYAEPLLAEIQINYLAKPQADVVEVVGDDAMASVVMGTSEVTVRHRVKDTLTKEILPYERDDMYRGQIQGLLDVIDGKEADMTTGEQGAASVALADAILKSLRSGGREHVVL
jgi:UDP-N-acetylglucosamine 3-dehydrogenase